MRRRRRNPTYATPSAWTLAEANLIQDAVLITLGVAIVGGVAYYLYKQSQSALASQGASQAAATKEVMGYTPPPNAPTTIPNPSTFAGANPLAPWLPPGPTASNEYTTTTDGVDYSTELGQGGSQDPLGMSAGFAQYDGSSTGAYG